MIIQLDINVGRNIKHTFFVDTSNRDEFKAEWVKLINNILLSIKDEPFYRSYEPHIQILLENGPYKHLNTLYITQIVTQSDIGICYTSGMKLT
jgi:hypothetical protein